MTISEQDLREYHDGQRGLEVFDEERGRTWRAKGCTHRTSAALMGVIVMHTGTRARTPGACAWSRRRGNTIWISNQKG